MGKLVDSIVFTQYLDMIFLPHCSYRMSVMEYLYVLLGRHFYSFCRMF